MIEKAKLWRKKLSGCEPKQTSSLVRNSGGSVTGTGSLIVTDNVTHSGSSSEWINLQNHFMNLHFNTQLRMTFTTWRGMGWCLKQLLQAGDMQPNIRGYFFWFIFKLCSWKHLNAAQSELLSWAKMIVFINRDFKALK